MNIDRLLHRRPVPPEEREEQPQPPDYRTELLARHLRLSAATGRTVHLWGDVSPETAAEAEAAIRELLDGRPERWQRFNGGEPPEVYVVRKGKLVPLEKDGELDRTVAGNEP